MMMAKINELHFHSMRIIKQMAVILCQQCAHKKLTLIYSVVLNLSFNQSESISFHFSKVFHFRLEMANAYKASYGGLFC